MSARPIRPVRPIRPIRIGIVDSGINPRDPQVGAVAGGIGIRFRDSRVERDSSWEDLLGHGTAVAATIRGHAPSASLYAIRIFHRRLEAHLEALLDAIHWGADEKLDLLNLSLGCGRPERENDFEAACDRAAAAGVVVVSADGTGVLNPSAGRALNDETSRGWGPAAMKAVVSVAADYELEEEEIRSQGSRFLASPWARRRGELPRERNFHGTSFAVAHVTGIAAKILAQDEGLTGSSLLRALSGLAEKP